MCGIDSQHIKIGNWGHLVGCQFLESALHLVMMRYTSNLIYRDCYGGDIYVRSQTNNLARKVLTNIVN